MIAEVWDEIQELASSADVILAIGCRFSDLHTSSSDPGQSFEIPPTKLVHADIDLHEIGNTIPLKSASRATRKR